MKTGKKSISVNEKILTSAVEGSSGSSKGGEAGRSSAGMTTSASFLETLCKKEKKGN